ncbi:Ger(x)C family spore germination protein [Paenibacillus sp. PL2-23]|uniref:Ger(x)C family spore germination protein n=1 Tax=Paenibacillus sp. PL2-23 TaxID=2100729 RepID=UPI0030F6C5ED
MVYKATIVILFMSFILTGCWSKYELTERAFVMGVALDLREDGRIEMLTQMYRPTSSEIGKSTATISESSVNIKTADDTVMEAIRDIPIHLGRLGQWSHMRVIIVGEKLARSMNLLEGLDFFYRDHEPRASVSIMISKGKAAKLFEKSPLIEQTTAQQLLRSEVASYMNAAKTVDTSLLDLVRDMKSAHPDTAIAYVYEDTRTSHMFSAAGMALIKDGRMTGVLPSSRVEGYLMLTQKYQSGAIEIRCPGRNRAEESVEVLTLDTNVKPHIQGEQIEVKVKIDAEISINELKCTKIASKEDERAFNRKVEKEISRQVKEAIQTLQEQKIDAIGIGKWIYRHHPKEWERLKPNWDERFAAIPFKIETKMKLVTNGTITSKKLSK